MGRHVLELSDGPQGAGDKLRYEAFVGYRISDLFQVASYIRLLPFYDEFRTWGLVSPTLSCVRGFPKHRVAPIKFGAPI